MKHNDWQLSLARDWAGGCLGRDLDTTVRCPVATVQNLALNSANSNMAAPVCRIF